uniref:Uncharacterized protein n=1 Tax=Arundo donax TaxID=35708 RepID=A0A0A9EKH1_ARUDO
MDKRIMTYIYVRKQYTYLSTITLWELRVCLERLLPAPRLSATVAKEVVSPRGSLKKISDGQQESIID